MSVICRVCVCVCVIDETTDSILARIVDSSQRERDVVGPKIMVMAPFYLFTPLAITIISVVATTTTPLHTERVSLIAVAVAPLASISKQQLEQYPNTTRVPSWSGCYRKDTNIK